MLTFQYTAKTSDSKQAKGIVQAETESAAAKLITSKGLTPLEIHPKGQSNGLQGLERLQGELPTVEIGRASCRERV